MVLTFWVDGTPIPQGSVHCFGNRVVHQKSKQLMAWREAIKQEALKTECQIWDGPVSIKLKFQLLKPVSVKRDTPHVKPDIDKLCRSVLDGLTGVAFKNDSQVINLKASKEYGLSAGVEITIWT